MHRYQPVIHITPVSPLEAPATCIAFPQTMFTTVTAYQNQQVRYSSISIALRCIVGYKVAKLNLMVTSLELQ